MLLLVFLLLLCVLCVVKTPHLVNSHIGTAGILWAVLCVQTWHGIKWVQLLRNVASD